MGKSTAKSAHAYLHDMFEAACLIRSYTKGIRLEEFWNNNEKRDAVALRLSVIGEAASRIDSKTAAQLPKIPFQALRGLRNRIAHDYGMIDFKIVWKIIQNDIPPLIFELKAYLKK